jgi:hypothetical protein
MLALKYHLCVRGHDPVCLAGTPPTNATFVCMPVSGYCYAYVTTTANSTNAAFGCAARGMQLVRYMTAEMQLEAESRVLPASTDYWIGLNYTSAAWRWSDGSVLGTGITPSRANPYAHWARLANSTAGAGTTAACVMGQATSAYSVYTGDGSLAQQNATFYNTTATNKTTGWLPAACSGLKAYMCFGTAATMYQCPPAPPPLMPSPPLNAIGSLCEYIMYSHTYIAHGYELCTAALAEHPYIARTHE